MAKCYSLFVVDGVAGVEVLGVLLSDDGFAVSLVLVDPSLLVPALVADAESFFA